MTSLMQKHRSTQSRPGTRRRTSVAASFIASLTLSLSLHTSAATELAALTAGIQSKYPTSYLADPANAATIEDARRFVAALAKEVDEQVNIYSDTNSEVVKNASRSSPQPPEAVLYNNLRCQKALQHFSPMLDPATATIEEAALFWYSSGNCVNTATQPFIRSQQTAGIAYEKVKKAISELAGGLNPASYRIQLPNADLQTLIALANTQIDEPAKAQAAAIYQQTAAPQSAPPSAVAPQPATDVEQFIPSISLLPPPAAYDETVVKMVGDYLQELLADMKKREPRARMHSTCSVIYTKDPAILVATNEFYATVRMCSMTAGNFMTPELRQHYTTVLADLQAFKEGYNPTLP